MPGPPPEAPTVTQQQEVEENLEDDKEESEDEYSIEALLDEEEITEVEEALEAYVVEEEVMDDVVPDLKENHKKLIVKLRNLLKQYFADVSLSYEDEGSNHQGRQAPSSS